MKKIGITQRLECEKKYGEIRNSLDIRWQKLLLSLGLIPLPISIKTNFSIYADLGLDGIILTGGNDLSSQSKDSLSEIRDKHEIKCIQFAIKNSIPLLGVCRGMQLIAEYFGSSIKKVENHVAKRHHLISVNNNVYNKYLSKIKIVNSYHNFAINRIGKDLIPLGICPEDNTIEAIQHKNYQIFGQMWHPEREDPFDQNNCIIISKFFDA